MNIEQLKIFTEIVETGSFRAAAERVHRTQPAITKAMQALEAQLDLSLFKRGSYRATLTDSGEKLYEKAKVLLKHTQEFTDFSNHLSQGLETRLGIAIDILFPIQHIAPILRDFLEQYPQTDFYFFSETLGGAAERLVDGDADLAITENLIDAASVQASPLITIPLIAVAEPRYLKKNREHFNEATTLVNTLQIILTDSSRHRAKYSFGVVEGARQWVVTDLQTKKDLIESGLGWGRLPDYLVKEQLKAGTLVRLDFSSLAQKQVTISLIRKSKIDYGPIAQALWEKLKTQGVKSQFSI